MVDELKTFEIKPISDEGAPRVMVFQRPLSLSLKMISLSSDLSLTCLIRVHSSAASASFLKGLMVRDQSGLTTAHI